LHRAAGGTRAGRAVQIALAPYNPGTVQPLDTLALRRLSKRA
jgi:hypothetical protein